jgi:hypothetical protein
MFSVLRFWKKEASVGTAWKVACAQAFLDFV